MSQFSRLLLMVLFIPALLIGCGDSNDTPISNKEGDFFGNDFNQNSSLSVADLLLSDSRFGTLTRGLVDVNLATTLDRQGPFTVYAPTDNAFARLPLRTRRILRRNNSLLREVLLQHIVDNEFSAFDMENMRQVRTLRGDLMRIRRFNGFTFVGGSRIVQTDGFVGNGVVHVVDEVIIPRELRPQLGL